jgi:DNA-binding PadR family transcriptional regulator
MFVEVKYKTMLYSSELIKGTLRTIILKLLCDQQKMYGYEITQTVKDLTHGRIQLTEGALYPTLHAMESEGLLTTEVEYIGKRVRKYYSVSKQGKAKAGEKINEFAEFMQTMRVLLNLDLGTLKVQ